jgi:hypothetical protein
MDYQGLEILGRQIRLIQIEPLSKDDDSDTSPIYCTIKVKHDPLPPDSVDFDISSLPSNYISFDHYVEDAPAEPYADPIRRDVAIIEHSPNSRNQLDINVHDLSNLFSLEDMSTIMESMQMNDNFEVNQGRHQHFGKLALEDLNPFFRRSNWDAQSTSVDPNNYVAMSYAWGPEEPTATIFLNGQKIEVRANLEAGLRQFRKMDYFRAGGKIWIDALCINQADKNEKELQIQMMTSVYKIAGNVIVWLGVEEDDSEGAIREIQFMSTGYRTEYVELFDKSDALTATSWREMAQARLRLCFYRMKKAMQSRSSNANQGYDDENIDADLRLYLFFDRPYWRRLWVIQELCMGRAGMPIVCGSQVTQWRYVRDAVFLYIAMLDSLTEMMPIAVHRSTGKEMERELSISHVAQIAQLEVYTHRKMLPQIDKELLPIRSTFRDGYGPLRGLAIRRALRLAAESHCSNAHDRVYGMLSVPGLPDLGIQIDYSKKVSTVYTEFAAACINKCHTLDVFSVLDCRANLPTSLAASPQELDIMPSWVPDFASESTKRVSIIEGDWDACGDQGYFSNNARLTMTLVAGCALLCPGYVVATVDGLGAVSKTDLMALPRVDGFEAGVVQPTSELIRANTGGSSSIEPRRDDDDDPMIYLVLVGGTDLFGSKTTSSFTRLYTAFPRKYSSLYNLLFFRNR